ncbi:MAG: hypothetical protein Q4G00_17185, partial [Clostridia bacterium]|nr:hypothetical protein [Clostridia bacterium]
IILLTKQNGDIQVVNRAGELVFDIPGETGIYSVEYMEYGDGCLLSNSTNTQAYLLDGEGKLIRTFDNPEFCRRLYHMEPYRDGFIFLSPGEDEDKNDDQFLIYDKEGNLTESVSAAGIRNLNIDDRGNVEGLPSEDLGGEICSGFVSECNINY